MQRSNPPRRVQTKIEGGSLTQQHYAKDVDVNTIVNRHMRGGFGRSLANIGNPGVPRQPIFGDFTSIDYQEMLNKVTDIDNIFRRLPAKVRSRFRNDPTQVIRFCEDPANMKEAVKLGLMVLPEGQVMTETGEIVEQTDIQKEAQKASEVVKADPEANSHNGPRKEVEK